jgi:hypothetical protein
MYNFLRKLFIKPKKDIKTDIDQQVWSSLEIQLNIDGTVNIICSWPEFKEKDEQNIHSLSEKYALMISAINKGFFSSQITDTLKNYRSDNYHDILFSQNVYYKILEFTYLEEQKSFDAEPVVKPLKALKYG